MRKTNRMVCLLAAGLTAVSMLVPLSAAAASEDIGLEAAITEARTRVEVPAEFSQFESNVSSRGGMASYILWWSTEENEYGNTKTIRITVNGKGDVVQYNAPYEYNEDNRGRLSKYTAEQLTEIAVDWLAQVNPDWMAQLAADDTYHAFDYSVWSTEASVRLKRYQNGLPFCDDYVSVNVDKQSGKVTSMYANWTYAERVPGLDHVISPEEAAEKFKALSPMELEYVSQNRSSEDADNQQILVYIPSDSDVMIAQADGAELTFLEGTYGADAGYETADAAANVSFEKSSASGGGGAKPAYQLTREEQENVEKMANLISAEDALKQLKAMPELGIEDFVLNSHDYSRYSVGDKKQEYQLHLGLNKGDGEALETVYATLDAQDGELLSYLHYNEEDYRSSMPAEGKEDKNAVTPERAQKIASDFAEKYASEEFASTRPQEEEQNEELYGVNLIRYENGVKCASNSIRVFVSPNTGKIRNYSKNWNDAYVFESTDGILTAEEAADALLQQVGLTGKYVDINRYLYGEKPADPRPVYMLDAQKPGWIAAKDGTLLDYSGEAYKEETPASEMLLDIDGHYGEEAIRALMDNGMLNLEEGQTAFRPDDAITQEELLGFVSRLVGMTDSWERDAVYRVANNQQIISEEEIAPEKLATREEAVKYIIRALGYNSVASLKDIYAPGFADSADITPGLEGYVALAKGFGIVRGDEANHFFPQGSVTRADAAIMIYNYLAR